MLWRLSMTKLLEAISVTLETFAKYSWAIFFVSLLIIILPQGIIESRGLETIRNEYLGIWHIALFLSAALWFGSLFSCAIKWKNLRQEKNTVLRRLQNLGEGEMACIKYCLLKNVQTIYAYPLRSRINSLINKGIVIQGTGDPLRTPFHINDFVWDYLRKHSDKFLTKDERTDQEKIKALEKFVQRLTSQI